MKKVFILKTDAVDMDRAFPQPFGVAVEAKEEAMRFIKEGDVGTIHSYDEICIFPNKDEAIAYANQHIYAFPHGTGDEFVENLKREGYASKKPANATGEPTEATYEYYELRKVEMKGDEPENAESIPGFFYYYNGKMYTGTLADTLTHLSKVGWRPVFMQGDGSVLLERAVVATTSL